MIHFGDMSGLNSLLASNTIKTFIKTSLSEYLMFKFHYYLAQIIGILFLG